MKTCIFIILLFISQVVLCQKMPSDYFDEGISYLNNRDYSNALKTFQYIIDNYQNKKIYLSALYWFGYTYYTKEDYDKATAFFKEMIDSNLKETKTKQKLSIIDYDLYHQYIAAWLLNEIYFTRKMYDSTLYYLKIADIPELYSYSGLYNHVPTEVEVALRFSAIYQKTNQVQKAIERLLPLSFKLQLYGSNSMIIDELKILLKNEKNLKEKLDNAINNLYIKYPNKTLYSYSEYYLNFLGVEIMAPIDYSSWEKEVTKERTIELIKNSSFYKMIESLEKEN